MNGQRTTDKGGRPPTGSIVWADPKTKTRPIGVRVTQATGKREIVRFDPGTTAEDAIALAPILAERARLALRGHQGETVAAYAERWLADREAHGIASAQSHDRGRLRKHVLPILGPLDVRTFGREDVERVVADLDRKIRLDDDDKAHLFWKTASNVWVLVSKMCSDMVDAKDRTLRVREDSPSARVAPPDRGEIRARNYLYPSEFRRLIDCAHIDAAFRIAYAVAVYTYMRAGELVALEPGDVDLEHNVIHVTRSVDRETGTPKSTKSGTTRRIPIEPELRALLTCLYAQRENATGKHKGRLLWLPDHEDRAVLLRQHLERADVTRAELLTSDARRRAITFHDLRATGITWAAVRGDDPLRIKQRAGHRSFSTTEGYIREAENLREGFGVPFPPLPAGLAEVSARVSAFRRRPTRGTANFPWYGVEQRGIEPRTSALRTQRSPS
jgi:integrase